MRRIYAKAGESINLGREVENDARQIYFKISDWARLFGEGRVQLIARRPDEADPYPVPITIDGDYAVWTVSNSDTAIPGRGNCELHYYAGTTLEKSDTWVTVIADSLGEASPDVPEPAEAWVQMVLRAGMAVEDALKRLPVPNKETGTWWLWNAEAGEYEDSGESYVSGYEVLFTPQTLTEAQQKQARENIGIYTATAMDALETLAELDIITPAVQDGVIYTDNDGAIFVL